MTALDDAVRDAIAVVRVTYGTMAGAITKEARPGIVALGGVMRACAIAEAITGPVPQRHPQVAGLLFRSAWETYVVTLFLLLEGESAYQELLQDTAYHQRILGERLADLGSGYGADLRTELAARGLRDQKLSLEQLANRIEPALKARAGEQYNRVFRGESLMSMHAGLGTFGSYVGGQREHASLGPIADHPIRSDRYSLFAAAMAVELGQLAATAWHADTVALDAAGRHLLTLLGESGDAPPPRSG